MHSISKLDIVIAPLEFLLDILAQLAIKGIGGLFQALLSGELEWMHWIGLSIILALAATILMIARNWLDQ